MYCIFIAQSASEINEQVIYYYFLVYKHVPDPMPI